MSSPLSLDRSSDSGLPGAVHQGGLLPYGQAGCPLPLLADLFDRVIQQSSRMHGVSSDLHLELVRFYSSPAL